MQIYKLLFQTRTCVPYLNQETLVKALLYTEHTMPSMNNSSLKLQAERCTIEMRCTLRVLMYTLQGGSCCAAACKPTVHADAAIADMREAILTGMHASS